MFLKQLILLLSILYQAKERREGSNKDYNNETEMISTTAHYRAVAPDAKA